MNNIYSNIREISYLKEVLERRDFQNILVFTGKKSYQKLSVRNEFEKILTNYNVVFYSDFDKNPKLEDILKAQKTIDFNYDIAIAIGGGSVIDFAKVYNFLNDQPFDIKEYIKNPDIDVKKINPLIAMPTTAGTGSEVTKFAVIYIDGKKNSLQHDYILPEHYIINPNLIIDAPRSVRAATAMDAFCQAIEGYFSVNSNDESDRYALKALEISKEFLIEYISENTFVSAEKMSITSNLAGKTINIAKTTVSHALSYFITSKYGVPHGHAVALSIEGLVDYNTDIKNIGKLQASVNKDKYLEKIKIFNSLGINIADIIKQSELEVSTENLGITDIEEIVNQVNEQRLKNNPLSLTKKDMKAFFDAD